jgi:hypothetical protein
MKSTKSCPLGAMLVKGHKTNIIQGKVKKKKDAS